MADKDAYLGARIDADLKNWVDEVVREKNVTKAEVMRYALERMRSDMDSAEKIKTCSRLERLMSENGHMYVVVQNNGKLELERVERKAVNFN